MKDITREHVVFLFPYYPKSKKAGDAYREYQMKFKSTHYQNWARWMKELCEPPYSKLRRYLIRLPGGHYAQPRHEGDLAYHTKAKTPKPPKKKPTLKAQLKQANDAYATKFHPSDPFL